MPPLRQGVALVAAGLTRRWDDRDGERGLPGDSRLVLGVPWGTLALCGGLLVVYAGLQRGYGGEPLVIPFTSWSYAHPVGVLLAPFAHTGFAHLVDNVTGVLVFGSVAEYAVGHYPAGATAGWRARPGVRAAGFAVGAALLGVLTSAFAWGPAIGSSSLVFALAGVGVVFVPLGVVVGLLAREALETLLTAAHTPVARATAAGAGGEPWWVDVAVQGHVFGFLLGVTVGALLLARRDGRTGVWRPAAAVWLLGMTSSFWALWWVTPGGFVLYRGPGVVLVSVGAILVAVAVRPITGGSSALGRRAGTLGLVVPLLLMAAVAVPINAGTQVDVPADAEGVSVRGYTVVYAEDVRNQRFDRFGLGPTVATGGVLVVDPERGIWTRAIPRTRLARSGTESVHLGGIGWERTVFAIRDGWRVAGGGRAYRVSLHPNHGYVHHAFASDPVQAAPVVDGRNVTFVPGPERTRIRVSRNGTVRGTAPVPARGENVTVGGLRVRRIDDRLIAETGRTRVPLARRE